MVEGRAAAGRHASRRLAVSGAACDEAHQHPPALSRGRRGSAGGRHRQAGRAAYAASQLRHPPAGGRTDIRIIQVLLGHAKLNSTAFYTKVATRTVRTVTSPLDKLGLFKPGEISPDG